MECIHKLFNRALLIHSKSGIRNWPDGSLDPVQTGAHMRGKTSLLDRQETLDHLNEIINTQSRIAKANFDVDGFMNLVAEQIQKLTPATGVVVELVEADDMVYRAATGSVSQHLGLHLNKNESISGLCVKEKKVLRCDDTEKDSRVNAAACQLVNARSMVVAPLFYNGEAVGALKILSDKTNTFSEEDVKTLQLMAGLIGAALAHQMSHQTAQNLLAERTQALEELKQAEEKLKYMANYDYLTSLPNRSSFMNTLSIAIDHAKQNKKLFALLFLDIDHFKMINDTLGHTTGDLLLKAFATRIKYCIRQTDTAARLGGDEFIILLEDISDLHNAIAIAKKIIEKMQEPFSFGNKKLNISTSIGITLLKENLNSDELIHEADQALYAAKKAGKNTFKVFKSED